MTHKHTANSMFSPMPPRNRRMIALSAALLLALSGCGEDSKPAQSSKILDTPVQQAAVSVNGEQIDASIVSAYARSRGLDVNDPAQKAAATRKVAEYLALAQAAQNAGYMAKPEYALDYLKNIAAGYVQSHVDNSPMSDADLKAEFDAQVALVAGREMTVSILSFNILERAQTAEREVLGGRPFDKLMSMYAGTEGVVKADTMSWTNLTQFPAELQAALRVLKVGETSPKAIPVDGLWHFVSIVEERPFVPPNFETVKEGIRKTLKEKRAQQHIADVLKQAKIQ
jgi:peptidyl-prolyl cis-trans isomerase C